MTDEPPATPGVPSVAARQAALERVVADPIIGGSPQLAVFLRYVVEAELRGEGQRIKAYTIGTEALGRSEAFDPQIDPIVRVEASRLRRALDRYYHGPGANDAVIITLPRGSYVPTFTVREPAPAPAREAFPWGMVAVAVGGVVAVVAVIVLIAVSDLYTPPSDSAGASGRAESVLTSTHGNGMPVLDIPAFEVLGHPQPQSLSAAALRDAIGDAFSQFDLINVVRDPPGGREQVRMPRIDYRLIGTAEYADDGTARLQFRLVDAAEGHVIWSRGFERAAPGDRAASETIVETLATTLAAPFGVIYAHGRAELLGRRGGNQRYRCIIEAAESFRSFNTAQHARARICLERMVAAYPNFALGFTYLAAIGLREYQYNIGRSGDTTPPLDWALRAARHGVEINPQSSRAYEMLFAVLFARGDVTAAFAAGDKAIELNKYDQRTAGAYAARLISRGDVEAGLSMLREVNHDGTMVPGFERFFLFLGSYLRRDFAAAAVQDAQLPSDEFQLGLVAHALTAATSGDRAKAQANLDRLVALNSGWRDDLAGTLGRFLYAPAIRDRLVADLTAAGIATKPAEPGAPRPTGSVPARLPPGNGMPTVQIEPLRVIGTVDPGLISPEVVSEKLIDAFARFDTVNVVATERPGGRHADYTLAGTIEYGAGRATASIKLVDDSDATIAWTRSFDVGPQQSAAASAERIVGAVATSLLQSYGVIRTRDRARQLVSSEGDPRYRCILSAADAFRSYDPIEYRRAKTCLEELTAQDPGFAVGFGFLSLIYYREYQQGFAGPPGNATMIERAVRTARHGIELNPASARAYQMLFVTLYARGDLDAAFAAGDRALALNKYDMLTLAEYGGRLIMTCQIDRGLGMLRQASEFWDVRPSWHYFYLFLGHYLDGDVKQAVQDADQITSDTYALGLVARILAAAASGDHARQQIAIDRLLKLQPAWSNPRQQLAAIIHAPDMLDKVSRDLAAAGLGAR